MRERLKSCARCGQIGHTDQNCKGPIDAAIELKGVIKANLARVFSLAAPIWLTDQFGPYCSDPEEQTREVPPPYSPDSSCLNCGAVGHRMEKCDEPSFADLLIQFGNLTRNSRPDIIRRQEIVEWLTSTESKTCA
jgi:hypothetical protein